MSKDLKFNACSGFEWDEGNKDKNWLRHGVSSGEAEQVFFNRPLFVLPSKFIVENRFLALGVTDKQRFLAIVFTIRDDKLRIISARPMSRKERAHYGKESKKI